MDHNDNYIVHNSKMNQEPNIKHFPDISVERENPGDETEDTIHD